MDQTPQPPDEEKRWFPKRIGGFPIGSLWYCQFTEWNLVKSSEKSWNLYEIDDESSWNTKFHQIFYHISPNILIFSDLARFHQIFHHISPVTSYFPHPKRWRSSPGFAVSSSLPGAHGEVGQRPRHHRSGGRWGGGILPREADLGGDFGGVDDHFGYGWYDLGKFHHDLTTAENP